MRAVHWAEQVVAAMAGYSADWSVYLWAALMVVQWAVMLVAVLAGYWAVPLVAESV